MSYAPSGATGTKIDEDKCIKVLIMSNITLE
jgi:hypothetical protein